MSRGWRLQWLAAAAVLAASAVARPARALDPGRPLTEYARRTWSVEQGLPQANVRSMAQTPDGYLWLATDGGVARFDGAEFTVFDSGNTAVMSGYTNYSL